MFTLSRRHFLAQAASSLGFAALGCDLWAALAESARAEGRPFTVEDPWRWRLVVGGDVKRPLLLGLHELLALPTRLATLSLVAPPGLSSTAQWEGLHLATLARLAEPAAGAKHLHVTCVDGHRDCFTVADLMRPTALFAHTRERLILGPEHGGPLRLVIPWRWVARSPVAVAQIDFRVDPAEGCDPLRGAIPDPRAHADARSDHAWSEAVRAVEIAAAQNPQMSSAGPWGPLPNPAGAPDPALADLYARSLDDASFELANQCRTLLVLLGQAGVAALSPERPWESSRCPLETSQLDARTYAHNVLAEVENPQATEWLLEGLRDPMPLVAALCLQALARRGESRALPRALDLMGHPDDGLALTAIAAVGALAPPGDVASTDRLRAAREAVGDPTRLSELDRVLAQRNDVAPSSPTGEHL
jgi:hypothetical protein